MHDHCQVKLFYWAWKGTGGLCESVMIDDNRRSFLTQQIHFLIWTNTVCHLGQCRGSPTLSLLLGAIDRIIWFADTFALSTNTEAHQEEEKRGTRKRWDWGKGGQEKSNGDSPIKINLHLEAFGIWRGWSLHRSPRKKLGKNAADWYWVALPSSLRSCCNKGSLQFVQPGPFLMLHKSGRDS